MRGFTRDFNTVLILAQKHLFRVDEHAQLLWSAPGRGWAGAGLSDRVSSHMDQVARWDIFWIPLVS